MLKHATAFLSHIGMNSTMEALLYQVPLAAFPQPQLSSRQCHDLGARCGSLVSLLPRPWAGGLSRCVAPPGASLVGVWLDRSAPRARLTRVSTLRLALITNRVKAASDSALDRGRSALVTDRWSTARAVETCSHADERTFIGPAC